MIEKKVYFIYQHPILIENQSDGLAFVFRDGDDRSKMYFYEEEEGTLYSDYENIYDNIISEEFRIKPATLVEICDHGYAHLIDTIVQYIMENGRVLNTNYIHIKDSLKNLPISA